MSLAARVGALEAGAEEARLRAMAVETGCSFEELRREVRELAPKVAAWRAAGMTGRQVLEQTVREAMQGYSLTDDEFRATVDEAERYLRDEVRVWWAR